MTDEELAEIERRFQSRIGTDKFLTIFDRDMKDLVAEVRRLKAENEKMGENVRYWMEVAEHGEDSLDL